MNYFFLQVVGFTPPPLNFTDLEKKFTFNGHIETVRIVINKKLIVCIYVLLNRPWHIIKNHLTGLLKDCEEIKQLMQCENIFITGDFNYDLHYPNEHITTLFKEHNLTQTVQQPTHNRGGILDLVFTDHTNLEQLSHPVYFTDHYYMITNLY